MQEDKNIEEYIIPEELEYLKTGSWKDKLSDFLNSRYFVPLVIVLVAIMAFALGRISGLQDQREPVRVISEKIGPARLEGESGGEVKGVSTEQVEPSQNATAGEVVGSKNGTKYHYPWCGGAKQISPKNLVTFNSIEEARAKGYTPASNCKGLK